MAVRSGTLRGIKKKGITPTRRTLVLLGLALLPYMLARFLMLVFFWQDFQHLGPLRLLFGLLHGVRFDLATVLPLLGATIFFFHLPGPWAASRPWILSWGWFGFATVAMTIPLLAGDLFYYGEVRRHMVRELLLLEHDLWFLPQMAFVHHPGATIGMFAFIVLIGWLWRRALAPPAASSRHPWLALGLVVCLAFLGMRGSVDRKPINPLDAYRGHSFALGNLSLNGVFTAGHGFVHSSRSFDNPLSSDAAFGELGLNPQAPYPALQSRSPASDHKNVILMVLESWDTSYLGCFGDTRGLTPHFDELAQNSRLYTNFYASTQRTIGAVQALLTGVPAMPDLPELSRGLEHTQTTRVARLAKKKGYHTIFIQAPYKSSYYLDAVMAALGFDDIYGKGEIPLRRDYAERDPKWGWDYDTLQFAIDRLSELPEPFFAVIITGTTHSPYADPGSEFRVAEPQPHGEGGYLNTLVYTDWAIGEFFERSRKSKWYERSVFLVGADHVHRVGSTDLKKAFHIPFLIHGAGIEPIRVDGIYSQLDVLPTLVEFLGITDPFASIGTSLMGPSPGVAVVKQGDRLGIIAEWGQITHTVQERIDAKITADGVAEQRLAGLERRLLAIHKVTSELIESNRWAPDDGAQLPSKGVKEP